MSIKCLVWDLDNTLWDGILSENDNVKLKDNVINVIKTLDKRGILQSISSKNQYDVAMKKLKELSIDEYFLVPKINWNRKSESLKEIAKDLNIGIDSLAFIDDQAFERDEVNSVYPEILTVGSRDLDKLLDKEEFIPRFNTVDSSRRREMYITDMKRKDIEENFQGTSNEFLSTLNLKMKISRATEEDLQRVEELTIRTHQLNTTGYTYSYSELKEMLEDPKYIILVAELEDVYGSYGKIGISLLERDEEKIRIKLFLMSCRVMSRGVGTVFMSYIIDIANKEKKKLIAEFIETDRNRIMYMTYRFMGFKEIQRKGTEVLLERETFDNIPIPDYVDLNIK